jgi:hypothetical protein
MEFLKPVTSAVKSCSNDCSMVLAYLLVFLMLPIDSMFKVNVQGQVKSVLSQLLNNDIGRFVGAVLFYVIWTTKDVMLLLLYLCLLKKMDLY